MSDPTVEPFITREVSWVETGCSLAESLHAIAAGRFSCVVVCEKEHPVGIITERDVVQLAARVALGKPPPSGTAGDLMTSPLTVVVSGESVDRAVRLMIAEEIRHLVVVDADGLLTGLLSQTDLLRARSGLPAAREAESVGSGDRKSGLPEGVINDRRSAERYYDLEIPARFWDGIHRGEGIIHDISASGALLRSVSGTVETGAKIKLEFSFFKSAVPVQISASVVRVAMDGFAVRFQSVSPRIQALLRSALRKAVRASGRS